MVIHSKVNTAEMRMKTGLAPPRLDRCTKNEIRNYFLESYDIYEWLFTSLKEEKVFYCAPDRLRLPLIFYYGHTAVVFVNKLVLAGMLKSSDRINKEIETCCETGVDEYTWDDTENFRLGGEYKWPSVEQVRNYRAKVKSLILKMIDETPLELPVTMDSPWWAVFMGVEHEKIHLETSSVLLRQLPISMVKYPVGWKDYQNEIKQDEVAKNCMIRVNCTEVTMGKPEDFPIWGWDNEYGERISKVKPFQASKYPITNAEYYDFMKDGGYENEDFWSEEGWQWKHFKEAKHPAFWICNEGCKCGCGGYLSKYTHCSVKSLGDVKAGFCVVSAESEGHNSGSTNGNIDDVHDTEDQLPWIRGPAYRLRNCFNIMDLPPNWPVEVNFHEAQAFCKWKGDDYRLLSEAEHNAIRNKKVLNNTYDNPQNSFIDGTDCNINMAYGSSTPVNLYAPNELGFHDIFGNVWEWLEDDFNGLPGFKTHHLYDDFATPTFDGRHSVILGGSWISMGDEATMSARFAFRRHFFQHAGFRIARNICGNVVDVPYVINGNLNINSDREYEKLLLKNKNINPKFNESADTKFNHERESYLDELIQIECIEKASLNKKIIEACKNSFNHLDKSAKSLIHIGCGIGSITFELLKYTKEILGVDYCAQLIQYCDDRKHERTKMEYQLDQKEIRFHQLTWLPNEIPIFDSALVTILDRVNNKRAWLQRLFEVIRTDGVLVIISEDNEETSLVINETISPNFTCIDAAPIENSWRATTWRRF